jgi:hypothetical protein
MIQLRTKKEFSIPTKRGVVSGIIRFTIDKLEVDINNITPKGYYYYFDENNIVVKLDNLGSNSMKQWELIEQVETNLLNPLGSATSLKANILQRLEEFTMLQLTTESGENYGTTPDDWEADI